MLSASMAGRVGSLVGGSKFLFQQDLAGVVAGRSLHR